MKKTSRGFISMMVVMTILMQMFVVIPVAFADDYSETVILSNDDFLNRANWSEGASEETLITTDSEGVLKMEQASAKGAATSMTVSTGLKSACDADVLVLEYDLKLSSSTVSGWNWKFGTLSFDNGYMDIYTSQSSGGKVNAYFAGDTSTIFPMTNISDFANTWGKITYVLDFTTGLQKLYINGAAAASTDG